MSTLNKGKSKRQIPTDAEKDAENERRSVDRITALAKPKSLKKSESSKNVEFQSGLRNQVTKKDSQPIIPTPTPAGHKPYDDEDAYDRDKFEDEEKPVEKTLKH
jgi:hypothetical protein